MALSVLVVDDDGFFRSTAGELLRRQGFEVAGEAEDAAGAIAAIAALKPDAVLLDVQLPDIDGVELAKRLSANGPRPRVVLTSSDPSVVADDDVRRCGAAGFVAKTELVVTRLADYLSG
jgi:DNA-binding NarL/FixJ family response regulator